MNRTSIYEGLRRIVLKSLFPLIVFTGTLLISGCPRNQDAVHVNRGNDYAEKGQYDQAISEYTKAIELNPRFADAYYNRGNAYHDKGLYDHAIRDYTRAIEIDPEHASAYFNRGNMFHDAGQYHIAISDYTKSIEIRPREDKTYLNRGLAFEQNGQHDMAMFDYNMAIELNPKFPAPYYNRGIIYAEKGRHDKAISDFNKAIELDPGFAEAYNNQAWLLATCPDERYRNGVKAVEMAEKAIESAQHVTANSLDTLAAAYAEAGRFQDAIATQTRQINMLKEQGKTNEIAKSIERIEHYKAHKPWR
jgi:tetratricopeptide (TPR) repeat protein